MVPEDLPKSAFGATRWSMVLAAHGEDSHAARSALAYLCSAYWYPLYAFTRRLGCSPHDAEDLTQSFFADLLRREALSAADPAKGRFRSFLCASLRHFLSHERARAAAQKRGGGQIIQPLDAQEAERRYGQEPPDLASPDRLFDRRWALTVLDRALVALRQECEEAGQARQFSALSPLLTSGATSSYAELAAHLGLSEGALKVAVHRLRKRYREALRREIAQTVQREEEIDEELRVLLAALE